MKKYNKRIYVLTINMYIEDNIIDTSCTIHYTLTQALNCFKDQMRIYKKYTNFDCVIQVVSCNRIKFTKTQELLDYFNQNINSIKNKDLYDFLLSLVECDRLIYNKDIKIIYSEIDEQVPKDCGYSNVKFTEESCKEGLYEFDYAYYKLKESKL